MTQHSNEAMFEKLTALQARFDVHVEEWKRMSRVLLAANGVLILAHADVLMSVVKAAFL